MFSEDFLSRLNAVVVKRQPIVVLTGAGVSAESGIPTFRGPEGFWTEGSVNYTPQEIGTLAMFKANPKAVWRWFAFRKAMLEDKQPNSGHYAIAELGKLLGSHFSLVSQNVDGLHELAGSAYSSSYFIHGTFSSVRCGAECSAALLPWPEDVKLENRDADLSPTQWEALICPKCGELLRPHVLWFDEFYNEKYFHLDTALRLAKHCKMLLIVGTSGSTNLPRRMVNKTLQRGGVVVDINPYDGAFREIAQKAANGFVIEGKSGDVLPELVELVKSYSANL